MKAGTAHLSSGSRPWPSCGSSWPPLMAVVRLSAEDRHLNPCHSDTLGSATGRPPGSAVMRTKTRLCHHTAKVSRGEMC